MALQVSVGDNAGASANACHDGGSVGDDGGSHFGVDHDSCIVGELIRVGNDGVVEAGGEVSVGAEWQYQ